VGLELEFFVEVIGEVLDGQICHGRDFSFIGDGRA
jgi:hypothetical protein